ncbi:unnamed protein product [Dovyalis caffra]|uniref:Response regulatory domain-containing protein n=1 Tax=Dovyalis caffra TaxID=77055 RepID=A0AAV1SP86_9ROSI|nr:unnamed protein product [Dovyalis caffra]
MNVGLVLDLDYLDAKIALSCINMALSDFYASHGDYKTRLILTTRDSKKDAVGAAAAALDLIKNVEVQAILGPTTSMQANFVIDLGEKAQVPIISFSASSPSLTSVRRPYFFRATQNDSTQVNAIRALIQAFGWREAVPIYVNNAYGEGTIPYLTDALQAVDAFIPYQSVISPSATDDQIYEELYQLTTMQTRVFIVHMYRSLGTRLFAKAKECVMMSEGYVWIVTDGLTADLLSSSNPSVTETMQGVLGVKPYVPRTKELESFRVRWKRKFLQDNPNNIDSELNIYGLWAYDAMTALAMAIEKARTTTFGFRRANVSSDSSMDLATLGVSLNGPNLLQAFSSTSFKGLAGYFVFVNGQLLPSAFQIVNVNGNGGRDIGFWTPKELVKTLNSRTNENTFASFNSNLLTIIWPGDETSIPKGWEIPTKGRKLRIAVSAKGGFIPNYNTTKLFGYSMIVPNIDNRRKTAWVFLKPFTWDLWVAREKSISNLSGVVVIISCLVGLILTQSYTAILVSLLTVQQLQPTITDVHELINKGEYVGYRKDSPVREILLDLGFNQSELMEYNSVEECDKLFSIGSRNGGIAAAFDEVQWTMLFLSKYCSKYTMIDPRLKTGGGFVFHEIKHKEDVWFGEQSSYPDSNTSTSSNSLSLESFWGLFLFAGIAALLALFIFTLKFVYQERRVLFSPSDSRTSIWTRIRSLFRIFNQRDLTCQNFRQGQMNDKSDINLRRMGSQTPSADSVHREFPGDPSSTEDDSGPDSQTPQEYRRLKRGSPHKYELRHEIHAEQEKSAVSSQCTSSSIPQEPESKPKPKILLVEDNKINVMVTKSMMKQLGHTMDVVNNGAEAVRAVQSCFYDLILMHAGYNGLQATQLIRSFEETGNWDSAIKAGIEPCAPSSASLQDGQISVHYDKRITIIAQCCLVSIPADLWLSDSAEEFYANGMDSFVSKPAISGFLLSLDLKEMAEKSPQIIRYRR